MTRFNMKSPLMRLVVDGGATLLLMLTLAYWWLGNLTHELAGTALFVLLGRHFINNSYWWTGLRKGRYDMRRRIGVVLNLLLALTMAVLLGTSFAISRSLFAWLPLPVSATMGEVHMFAAYWVMAIVGLHIGLNWNRVAIFARNLGTNGPVWRWLSWLAAIALAIQGIRSATVMDFWTRLRLEMSLAMWDFNESVAAYFGHWLAILALMALLMHCAMLLVDRFGPAAASARTAR